jgi:methyltransferase (TIGR00027 family)
MSIIAHGNARFRANEALHEPAADRILNDVYAHHFDHLSARGRFFMALRAALPPVKRLFDELQVTHTVRHRSIDEIVSNHLSQTPSCDVVISLASGFDTRPLRLNPNVPWVECDMQSVVDEKNEVLQKLNLDDSARVTRSAIDLRVQRIADVDALKPFLGKEALIILEGLTQYLTREQLETLLSDFCNRFAVGSTVVFSFVDHETYWKGVRIVGWIHQFLREVPVLYFKNEELVALCKQSGFTNVETLGFFQQIDRFCPQARHRRTRLGQSLAIGRV